MRPPWSPGSGAREGASAVALAAVVDEDAGPTFVLEGRIVTMSRRGVVDGRLAVRSGRIAAIVASGEALPAALRAAPVVATQGTIYPGLIDLHNHYVYDIAPLWRVPRLYNDRSQWADVASKKAEVSLPVKLLAGWPPTAKAIVRYVEAKALAGGTTTGQGMKTQVKGGYGAFRGAMRNVESTEDPRLPESATLVPTLGRRIQDFAEFRAALDKRRHLGGDYFYHLAEGTGELALRTYTDLRDNGLLQPPLVGVHGLGLGPEDLGALHDAGAKLVWSPFSNLLLYGQTLHLEAVLASRLPFAIGSDWSPSGSKNLLEELKVARHAVRDQGASVGAERLVRAVTSDAAAILGWSAHLGRLREGAFADLLVIGGTDGDPYEHLIDATERDVRLVAVHGVPRYGARALMEELHADPGLPLEPWTEGGLDACFQLSTPSSTINDLRLGEATATLREALADLHAFRDRVERGVVRLRAMGVEPAERFSLVLDNEPLEERMSAAAAAADRALLPASVALDELVVGGEEYWSRVADQPNLDQALKDELRAAYAS
jgi:5-methylthioadenosine/S-adenosylhomocysteine deaminase